MLQGLHISKTTPVYQYVFMPALRSGPPFSHVTRAALRFMPVDAPCPILGLDKKESHQLDASGTHLAYRHRTLMASLKPLTRNTRASNRSDAAESCGKAAGDEE